MADQSFCEAIKKANIQQIRQRLQVDDVNRPLDLAGSAAEDTALIVASGCKTKNVVEACHVVKLILEAKADPDITNRLRVTPLMAAARQCDERFRLILDATNPAKLNARDHKGQTVFHYLSDNGESAPWIKTLIKNKADPNITDQEGNTPLLIGVRYAVTEFVTALLECDGMATDIRNEDGETATSVAPDDADDAAIVEKLQELVCNYDGGKTGGTSSGKVEIKAPVLSTGDAAKLSAWQMKTPEEIFQQQAEAAMNPPKPTFSGDEDRIMKTVEANLRIEYERKNGQDSKILEAFTGDYRLPIPFIFFRCPLDTKKHHAFAMRVKTWLESIDAFVRDLTKIDVVYNPERLKSFCREIATVERRNKTKEFQPDWSMETSLSLRKSVLSELRNRTDQTQHSKNKTVQILCGYHGTDEKTAQIVIQDGFAALSRTDDGWFGKGLYFTTSPEYAKRYAFRKSGTPCIVMCYVIILNPFPIITDDAPPGVEPEKFRFYGKGNHGAFQSHYLLTGKSKDVDDIAFRPPHDGEPSEFDELVVFHPEYVLPQLIIKLNKPTGPAAHHVAVEIPRDVKTTKSDSHYIAGEARRDV